jgi:hypothetical protein
MAFGAILAIPFTAGGQCGGEAALAAGDLGSSVIGAVGTGCYFVEGRLRPRTGSEEREHDGAAGGLGHLRALRTIDQAVADQFRGYGGTILSTTLSSSNRRGRSDPRARA